MNTILPLTEADLDEAYALEQLCHDFPWSKKNFFSNQGDNYFNLKIVEYGRIVGFCLCQLAGDEATLFNLAIHPHFRRKKYGHQLVGYLINSLSLINIPMAINTLWLEVRLSNVAAINLYQQIGFNEITIRKNYYPTATQQREDAIIMAYTLHPNY